MTDTLASIPARAESSAIATKIYQNSKAQVAVEIKQRLEQAVKQTKKIVLVYQMGKVGSKTYAHKLAQEHGLLVLHVHRLNPSDNKKMVAHYLQNGQPRLASREHQWQAIYQFITERDLPIYIVSAMREPVARNISAYFQNLSSTDDPEASRLINQFFSDYPHRVPLEWFESQFNQALGIDIEQYPFDRKQGWSLIEKENYHCLLMTAEAEDEEKVRALNQFLNLRISDLPHQNSGELKNYADIYARFKTDIKIPASYIETMLNNQLVEYFYRSGQIANFRKHWLETE